jgi:NADP-dependent 3-hydroxy acid dehydrogenase YdfG
MPVDAPARVVVVTGADRAEGAAAARALAAAGHPVVCCGTDAGALGALAAELPSRAVVFVDDVTGAKGATALQELVGELFARG